MSLLTRTTALFSRLQIRPYSTVKKVDPVIASLGKTSAKKKTGKGGIGGATTKMEFDVETDAKRLVTYVCGTNILKEGGEDIKLKPDSEYPEWLWSLNTSGKQTPLSELDPNTLEYWKRVRKMGRKRINYLKSVKPF